MIVNRYNICTGFGDLKAPDGSSVNDNFLNWFSESVVVGKNNQPLILFHGTKSDIDSFKSTGQNGAAFGTGFYFSDSAIRAKVWAKGGGGNIVPAYLRLESPAYFSKEDDYFEAIGVNGFIGEIEKRDAFNLELKLKGHDGIIVCRTQLPGKSKEYVAFDPSQIKSAIGNSGYFSNASNDLVDHMRLDHRIDYERGRHAIEEINRGLVKNKRKYI